MTPGVPDGENRIKLPKSASSCRGSCAQPCAPRGELKEKVSSLAAERFQMHSGLKAEALAASNLYGEWRWKSAIGVHRTKRRAA
jgi:hypothetical protein